MLLLLLDRLRPSEKHALDGMWSWLLLDLFEKRFIPSPHRRPGTYRVADTLGPRVRLQDPSSGSHVC